MVCTVLLHVAGCRSIEDLFPPDAKAIAPRDSRVLHYTVDMKAPHTHYISISILTDTAIPSFFDIAMPAWSPGKYRIMDFARHVRDVRAYRNGSGEELALRRRDKQTWRISGPAPEGITVTYRVYANYMSGTFSQLHSNGALINGASVFMYPVALRRLPILLSVKLPEEKDWEIATALPATKDPFVFHARNYLHLVDCPISIGHIRTYAFQSHGKRISIVYQSPFTFDFEEKLSDNCRRVCDAAGDLFGGFPFFHYRFIFHFNVRPGEWDAMEHRSSAVITDPEMKNTGRHLMEKTTLTAHELFHVWNVKCIRPCCFAHYDLSKETYTESLWVVEGLTKYYQYVLLLRAGLISRKEFREKLEAVISGYESNPGRTQTSLNDSSLLTWLDRSGPEDSDRNNTRVSYYNKGAVVGLLLDLRIRGLTGGEKGLDDVFRYLYRNYYLKNKCYMIDDFYTVCSRIAGLSLDDFFSTAVRGVGELPYAQCAAPCGFVIENANKTPRPYFGVLLDESVIINIFPGSPAEKAGCQKYDRIDRLNGEPFSGDLTEALNGLAPGDRVGVTVSRNGLERDILVDIGSSLPVDFIFSEKSALDTETKYIRNAFYTGKKP